VPVAAANALGETETPESHHGREAAGLPGVMEAAGIEPAQDFNP
jgi:hypothetical protein